MLAFMLNAKWPNMAWLVTVFVLGELRLILWSRNDLIVVKGCFRKRAKSLKHFWKNITIDQNIQSKAVFQRAFLDILNSVKKIKCSRWLFQNPLWGRVSLVATPSHLQSLCNASHQTTAVMPQMFHINYGTSCLYLHCYEIFMLLS